MKSIWIAGLLLLTATAARAQTIEVANIELNNGYNYYNIERDFYLSFDINKELGRAWISAMYREDSASNGHSNSPDRDEERRLAGRWLLDGLSYNAATSQILYKDKVVANVKPGFFFGIGYQIENAPGVSLKLSVVRKSVDNGFEVYTVPFEVISLELN